MMLKNCFSGIILILLYSFVSTGHCQANKLSTTKQQLAQLSTKIRQTENTLTQAKKQRTNLQTKLALQEKTIGKLIIQKNQLDTKINVNKNNIKELSQQIKVLNEKINTEQLSLAKHIRSRYMIDVYQPIKWILSPDSKDELSQILSYYKYVIRSQQEIIQSIANQTENLKQKKFELKDRIDQDKKMHHLLADKQSKLESAQRKQQTIIERINKTISSKSQKLKTYRDNQAGLAQILAQLTKQDRIAQSKPFANRRHHLPRPVSITIKAIQPIHQGLAFFATEGTSVKAVHPGKVLFSDWLKGYGLLLIIDHGHGYMTLYAHNQALTKRKGDWVDGGEKIAEVGHSGGLRENGLYFEIRHNGKAISPINWLS